MPSELESVSIVLSMLSELGKPLSGSEHALWVRKNSAVFAFRMLPYLQQKSLSSHPLLSPSIRPSTRQSLTNLSLLSCLSLGCREGSTVKCGPPFSSQHANGGSQTACDSSSGAWTPSLASKGSFTYVVHINTPRHTHKCKTYF